MNPNTTIGRPVSPEYLAAEAAADDIIKQSRVINRRAAMLAYLVAALALAILAFLMVPR